MEVFGARRFLPNLCALIFFARDRNSRTAVTDRAPNPAQLGVRGSQHIIAPREVAGGEWERRQRLCVSQRERRRVQLSAMIWR